MSISFISKSAILSCSVHSHQNHHGQWSQSGDTKAAPIRR
uniref:Uncharacterized protein n=1 Tax=Arundo donax TaxID=35708 RepID=A0A0A9HUZ8_ARUDO